MSKEIKAFENNEVLLWGLNKVKKDNLIEYDYGNKNPHSINKKKKDDEPKEPKKPRVIKKREFEMDGDYGIDDIEFLNKEYERLDDLLSKTKYDTPEYQEYEDKVDKISELLEGLEHLKKISGKGVKTQDNKHIEYNKVNTNFIIPKQTIGKGFKKGSPEAIAHAEKMRKAIQAKKTGDIVVKKTLSSKSRVVKGSEEAKEIGRRLAEAKKKKLLEKIPKEQPVIKKTGKPWFYIGDIPKGYREATEDEAILNLKVSEYGKYEVDSEKYRLFKDFDIFLTENKTDREMMWSMNGLKKRVLKSLSEIEILKSKIDNPKYEKNKSSNESKLTEEKYKNKILQAGYNWYNKILSERQNKEYVREKIQLPIKEIKTSREEIEYKPPPRPIDPRTGEEVELYIPQNEDIKKPKIKVDFDLMFENEKDEITLSSKYFTEDYKLKPKYSKKLLDKGIILQKKHYTTDDYNKYFFKQMGRGIYKRVFNNKK